MKYKTPLRGFSTTPQNFVLLGPRYFARRVRNKSDTRAIFPRNRRNEQNQDGLTLSELLVVIILTGLFSSLILSFTLSYWQFGYKAQADLDTLSTRLSAGDFLREQIGSSSGLIIQNGLADSHALVPDPSAPSHWTTIHAIPGNKPVGSTGTYTPLVYFKRFSFNPSKQFIMNGVQPYEDEYVLYMNGTTKSLMQRSIANPSAPSNKLLTSCPPNLASSSCPSDKTIATDLASVDMRYFSRTGNLIDYTAVWDSINNTYAGPDFTAAEVVEFTLHLTAKANLQTSYTTQNTTIIRVALRNS